MKRVPVLLALALLGSLCASAEEKPVQKLDFFLARAIPHFAAGGPQWQTTFIFHNPSDTPEKFYLNFTGDNGKPLAIPILGGMSSSVLVTLPAHATRKLVTDYRPDLSTLQGSAYVTDPYTCSDCEFSYSTVHTIFALYDWQQRKFLCEATVPQESPYENNVVLVYDQEQSYVTALALMNPSTYSVVKVMATMYDKDDHLLRTDEWYMDPLAHTAFALADKYPETANKIGYMRFSTTGVTGVAGIGLRFSPNSTFTSMHFITAN